MKAIGPHSRPWSGTSKPGPGDVELFRYRLLKAKLETEAVDRAVAARQRDTAAPASTTTDVRDDLAPAPQDSAYREVPVGDVAPPAVDAATATVRLCASLLDLDTPKVRWFVPEDGRQPNAARFMGVANLGGRVAYGTTDEVWIRAGRSVRDVMSTAAHETRHCAQPDPRLADDPVRQWTDNELEAHEFTDQFVAAYLES